MTCHESTANNNTYFLLRFENNVVNSINKGYDNQGGFGSQGTPQGQTKARRNYDEQTLIPCTIKQIVNADGDPTGGNDISLKDGRTLYMVKIVGCVRNFEQKSTNLAIEIEDGTGMMEVKTWMNEGDDCSAVANLRQECCQDHVFIRAIGQVKEFDGKRHIQATDIRLLGTKNEFTYHFLEVAYSFDKYQKRKESGMGMGMGVGMGYGIGNNMSSMPKTMGANVSMNQGGGNSISDAVSSSLRKLGSELDLEILCVNHCIELFALRTYKFILLLQLFQLMLILVSILIVLFRI